MPRKQAFFERGIFFRRRKIPGPGKKRLSNKCCMPRRWLAPSADNRAPRLSWRETRTITRGQGTLVRTHPHPNPAQIPVD